MTDEPTDPYAPPPAGWQPPSGPAAGGPPPAWQPPAGAPPSPPQPQYAPMPPPYAAPPGWQPPPPPPPPYAAPPGWQQPQHPQFAAPGWGPGHAGYGYQQPPRNVNGMSIAALTCSIVLSFLFGLGAVLGIAFGIIGLKQCRQRGERGRGLAIAGIVIGGIGGLLWILAAIGLATDNNSDNTTNVGVHHAVTARY